MIITALRDLNHWFHGHPNAGELFVVALMLWPLWVILIATLVWRWRRKA